MLVNVIKLLSGYVYIKNPNDEVRDLKNNPVSKIQMQKAEDLIIKKNEEQYGN